VNKKMILRTATQEMEDRAINSVMYTNFLLDTTIDYIAKSAKGLEDIKNTTITALNHDIEMINKLNNYISSNSEVKAKATWPLKTNKNLELYNCAKDIIEQELDLIADDTYWDKYPVNALTPTILGGNATLDYKGTSLMNCFNTALFTILYSNTGANSIQKLKLAFTNSTTEIDISSPNIHSTKLPENINHAEVDPKFKNWIYFYQDELSPNQGELLSFTLGYSFGGSREDSRYHQTKYLKPEDCSSSVAKWVGSYLPFSTADMEQLFKGDCNGDYCEAAKEVLRPITDGFKSVEKGDIYAFRTSTGGGHTGIVTDVYTEKNCFESHSYSRDMPKIEGLGYREECPEQYANRNYMFFEYHEEKSCDLPGTCTVEA